MGSFNGLNFLGTGSCFNTAFGNNSAYYFDKERKHLFLIDCGESIFERLNKTTLLSDAKEIDVVITHLHSDHAGSLASLIFFCKYAINITPTVIYPNKKVMREYLRIGGVTDDSYNLLEPFHYHRYSVQAIPQEHTPSLEAYGYTIIIEKKTIFYSGDSKTLNSEILIRFLNGFFDYFYQDTSRFNTSAHMNIFALAKLIPVEKRHQVTCMHFDDNETKNLVQKMGFKIAKTSNHNKVTNYFKILFSK